LSKMCHLDEYVGLLAEHSRASGGAIVPGLWRRIAERRRRPFFPWRIR
jgi:hypothetical protein